MSITSILAPKELTAWQQWVAYRLEPPLAGGHKLRKVPYSPLTGFRASSTDPDDWATYQESIDFWLRQNCSGVGFVFTKDDPFAGVDLDHCRDPETGTIEEWAWKIIRGIDSYTEVSPSGTGVKIFLKGELPPGARRRSGNIEMYDNARYFTVTGEHLPGTPTTIEERGAELLDLHTEVFPAKSSDGNRSRASPHLDLDDTEIISKGRSAKNGAKFAALYDGRWQELGYQSQSEGDLALASMLTYWCRGDQVRIDRLFRQSGLYRPKWDERRGTLTYGQKTVEEALTLVTEFYTPVLDKAVDPREGPSFSQSIPWPEPLAEEAFHGLAGTFVRAIDPHTEADPVALLLQILVAFGSVVGRGPYFMAEADRHYTNIYAVLVGTTSKGRKGTSQGHVRRVFLQVEQAWAEQRVEFGLSSGEGLIWAVRDPIERIEPVKEKGRVTAYESVTVDEGVVDKRLLVFEAEFASTLRVLSRDGNTLSPVIRNAWDTGELHTLTKNSPARATGAHISIVGHITKDELLRHLDNTEAGNGFGNRFLWGCVRRSKMLPDGGRIEEADLDPLVQQLKDAVDFARGTEEMRRDEDARTIWHAVYPSLSEGKPGLLGAMIARAEAQVMRLACIYALLDRSPVVRKEHLWAGIAVWDYCEASARFIFGSSLGDPLADELLVALRSAPQGLTRTEIRDLFGRHKGAAAIGRALCALSEHGLARCVVEQTDGRSAERWIAIVANAT